LQQIVDEWIEQYKADRDSGLRAIMQFFISASGCKGKITSQMQSSMEHAAIIRRMTEEFDEVLLYLYFFPHSHEWYILGIKLVSFVSIFVSVSMSIFILLFILLVIFIF
jgi:cohesin complex subunit SA-1/2